ncbi:MAG: hypothetical protein AAB254_00420, partial [candidate division NC10 bacterium]
ASPGVVPLPHQAGAHRIEAFCQMQLVPEPIMFGRAEQGLEEEAEAVIVPRCAKLSSLFEDR